MDSDAGGTYVDVPGRGPTEVVEVNGLHVLRSHVDRLGPLLTPAVTSHLCRAGVTPALGGRWRACDCDLGFRALAGLEGPAPYGWWAVSPAPSLD